jgi:hypothetical protein
MSIAEVRLSIDVGSDPIAGSLHTDRQQPQRFSGWVELAAAIEAARAAQQADPDDKPRARTTKD